MISKTIDMAQASENFQTITLVINNSVLNKSKYYNILKELNSQVFNCNVKVKLVNNEGLFDYIEHAFLNRDIYNKLLNLDFVHEPIIPINNEYFKTRDKLITTG
tara:strand:+ start:86 stop:397 length:312 start_codon:yes stop_codon:yes gene_type:complete